MNVHDNGHHAPNRAGFGTYAWRFASGQHMSGKRHTNSTFRFRGTRDLTDHGHASKWSHRAGWERAAYRIGYTAVTIAILYGFIVNRSVTIDSLAGAMSILTVLGVWRSHYLWNRRKHHRQVVKPLYQTMSMITAINTIPIHLQPYNANHKKALAVPMNYRHPKARVKFTVPETWEAQPAQVKRLTDLIERRLGGDWDSITHLNTYPPYIEFMPSPAPPNALTFTDILPAIEKAKNSEIVMGKGTHDRVISIDLDSESPHCALAMGTGGGKSSTLRLIIIQLIKSGCERIDILDIKRASHTWAKSIPGVYIHTTMQSMINATAEFKKEMERRYEILENDETATFPRRVLIVEEQNSLMAFARQYWSDFRNELEPSERNRVPKTCPLISDIGYALFMGRQSRCHVISVFQRLSANAAGGGDMRDQYGCKILARFSPATWSILVATRPIPRSSKIPGRARFVLGDSDHELQTAFINEKDAKAFAMQYAKHNVSDANEALTLVDANGAGSDDIPAMSLREMVEANLIPVRYSTATRARTRAGDTFPRGEKSPNGVLYNPSDVQQWFVDRKKK